MPATRALGLLVLLAPFASAGGPQKGSDPADKIAVYRKYLLGPDPEPAKSEKRALAILSLVRSDDPRAHEVLRAVLAAAGDPERAPPGTIPRVLHSLHEQALVDLAPKELLRAGAKERIERRLRLYAAYVPAFVRLAAALAGKKPPLPPGEAKIARAAIAKILALLPGETKRKAFEPLLHAGDRALVRAAIRLAGGTEDPRMAGVLAPLLADAELRPLVQEAMGRLTLRPEPFRDLADYRAWEARNGGKTWAQLAREAALDRQAFAQRLEAQHRAELLALAKRLVEVGLAATALPWDAFQALLDDPALQENRLELVGEISRGLFGRKPGNTPGGARLEAFLKRVFAGYQNGEGGDRLAWLELYTAAARFGKDEVRERARSEVLRRLSQRDRRGRVCLYKLLAFFPGDEVRAALLSALETELEGGSKESLAAGLEALHALRAPKDPDLGTRLQAFLARCVRAQKLDPSLRERALDLIGQLDGKGAGEMLRRLFALGPGGLAENLRLRSLGWIQTLVASRMQAGAGETLARAAKTHLAFLLQALRDPSPNVRRQVARMLARFPPAKKNFSATEQRRFALEILGRIGEALLSEENGECLESLRAALAAQARAAGAAGAALEKLVLAVEHWAKAGARALLDSQAGPVRAAAAELLREPGHQPAHLLELAARLTRAGRLAFARLLLTAPACAELEKDPPKGAAEAAVRERRELRRRRASLVLQAAGAEVPAEAAAAAARCRFLLGAARGLAELGAERPEVLVPLGQAELDCGRPERAAAVLDRFLKSSSAKLPPDLVTKARLLLARAWLASGRAAEAAALLRGSVDQPSRVLRVRALAAARDWAALEEATRRLLGDPALAHSGPLREDLALERIRALVGLGRLDDAAKAIDALPLLENEASKQKLAVLRKELEAARRRAPASRPSAPGRKPKDASSTKPAGGGAGRAPAAGSRAGKAAGRHGTGAGAPAGKASGGHPPARKTPAGKPPAPKRGGGG